MGSSPRSRGTGRCGQGTWPECSMPPRPMSTGSSIRGVENHHRSCAKFVDEVTLRFLSDLVVRCEHKGCTWDGSIEQLKSHVKECQYHPDRVPDWVLRWPLHIWLVLFRGERSPPLAERNRRKSEESRRIFSEHLSNIGRTPACRARHSSLFSSERRRQFLKSTR